MKKSILLLFILLIPVLALAQTAEEYLDKGIAKGELGDYRGAIQDFNKALELDPIGFDQEAYYGRGASKINLGQKDSGCLDMSKAGELGYSEAYEIIKEYCQ